jgi:hypothetical protein
VKQSKEHLKLEGRFGIQTFVCSSSEKKKKGTIKERGPHSRSGCKLHSLSENGTAWYEERYDCEL